MNTHWTARSVEKFQYRITSDFLMQLEKRMETAEPKISQAELAKRLKTTPGRVSQVLNGALNNFELETVIRYAAALGMKVSLVAYEDNDPDNTRGPIDSEIFTICWEKQGKPVDYFQLSEGLSQMEETDVYTSDVTPSTLIEDNVVYLQERRIARSTPANAYSFGRTGYRKVN